MWHIPHLTESPPLQFRPIAGMSSPHRVDMPCGVDMTAAMPVAHSVGMADGMAMSTAAPAA